MDKNLISIDDLMRQRLSGGEEQERAGAWMQMRDLLDKEMPQAPGGMLYWRRTLSAVAVLLLITTVSIGSYKLYNSVDGKPQSGAVTASAVAVNKMNVAGAGITNAPVAPDTKTTSGNKPGNNKGSDNKIVAAGSAVLHNDKTQKHIIHTAEIKTTAAKEVKDQKATSGTDVVVVDGQKAGQLKSVAATTNTANEKVDGNGNKQMAAANKVARNDEGNKKINTANTTNKKVTAAKKAAATSKEAGKQSVATNNVTTNKANNGEVTSTKNTDLDNKQASGNNDQVAATDHKKSGKKPNATVVAKTNTTTVTDKQVAKNNNGKKNNTGNAKPVAMKNIALGSHTSSESTMPKSVAKSGSKQAIAAANKNKINEQAILKKNAAQAKALAANVNDSKAIAAKNAAKINKTNKAVAVKNTKPATTLKGTGSTGVAGTNGDKASDPSSGGGKPGDVSNAMKTTSAMNMSRGKRVIQTMELYQHLIKNNPESADADRRYYFDTLSMGTLTQELGVAEENTSTANKNSGKKAIPGNNGQSSAPANQAITPGAAPTTPANIPADQAKTKKAASKGSGVSMIENLQAKFNDIKYNVAAVQFAPGVTGGINGTFFGPNSFKGFQFGVSGDFIFNDKWSMMVELKYVHRVNNDFTMNDNYNTYTKEPWGVYEKDSFAHSYSFSTLHSFELPITLGYTKGNFTFYGGGNLVYTLGVNPDQNPLQAPIPPVYVNTPGSNGTAKFTPDDLESTRFGIGYLFGFGYKIAPNMTLDLRNVQTLWDNANNSGSHFVSSQLYRSPSLQLSFAYRFGADRDKE